MFVFGAFFILGVPLTALRLFGSGYSLHQLRPACGAARWFRCYPSRGGTLKGNPAEKTLQVAKMLVNGANFLRQLRVEKTKGYGVRRGFAFVGIYGADNEKNETKRPVNYQQ